MNLRSSEVLGTKELTELARCLEQSLASTLLLLKVHQSSYAPSSSTSATPADVTLSSLFLFAKDFNVCKSLMLSLDGAEQTILGTTSQTPTGSLPLLKCKHCQQEYHVNPQRGLVHKCPICETTNQL